MTDKTETKQGSRGSELAIALTVTVAFLALFVWVAGIALNKGYGVHVPFFATFLLLGVGLCVVKTAASEVASTWHNQRIQADITLLAATMAANDSLKDQHLGGLGDILSKLSEHDDTDSGAYL